MICVEVVRGNFVESRHYVYGVVVDELGNTVHEYGDGRLLASPRSAIKFLQALPLVESGAADTFHLRPEQIALACASHNGEDRHIQLVETWMKESGIPEAWLHCGPHLPYFEPAAREWICSSRTMTAKLNNCSGKHLGMMTTALHLKEDAPKYFEFEHPRQKYLRKLLTEVTGFDHETAPWGVDGCGIPTYALPILNMAQGMSYLIRPNKTSKDLQRACQTVLQAVKENPYFIAGTGDFNTTIIEKTKGQSLIKVGAEGVYCGVLPEKGLAFALKCLDGNLRAAEPATAWLLKKWGALDEHIFPPIKNTIGESVGEFRVLEI